MQIFNGTDLSVAAVPSLASSEGPELTIVVKGTFRLAPDGVAEAADEAHPPTGDTFPDDDPTRPLLYPSDFAPFKPRADLLLVGTAFTPGRVPSTEVVVGFAVGTHRRDLLVSGDRHWEGRLLGRRRPSHSRPFTSMTLGYDRAFGGSSIAENPLGIGSEEIEDELGGRRRPLPNVEDPSEPVRSAGSRPEPAGFGPIPDSWPQRARRAGRFPRSYRERHWPALPPDFDWSYFNAAPAPMQVPYLQGDEPIELLNLHPERATYRSRLPGLRIRCFVEDSRENGEPRVREATLRLDTLWIDADAEELVLVWRGNPGLRSKEGDEVEALWFVAEPLEDEPRSAAEWVQQLHADRDAAAEAPQPEAEPEADENEAAIEAAFQEQFGRIRDQLASGGVPAGLLAKLETGDDPDGFIQGLFDHLGIDPARGEQIQAEANERFARMLEDAGEDPALFAPPTGEGAGDSAALRSLVESRHAAGESVAEEDLSDIDLSGAALPGIDLRGAVLENANLAGADLEGADLTGANLSGANLRAARLGGAKLGGADLTGADAGHADLGGALLEWAVADGADFTEARLVGVEAGSFRAAGADLSRADLTSAHLSNANLESSTLHGTVFAAARLAEASLQGAAGDETDLRGADCEKLRASDGARLVRGRFAGILAPDSMWAGSDLSGSDFSGAELPGADLSGCVLRGASFAAANLRRANASKADFDEAVCSHANLFEGNLYAARIGRADFSHANLFGADTFDALFEDAVLDGADVRRTQLEGST